MITIQTNKGSIEVNEATLLFNASCAEAHVEEALQEFFDGSYTTWEEKNYDFTFYSIGWDPYDCSIEIYLRKDAKYDEQQLLETLKVFGFTFGWLNFSDGTEVYFNVHQTPSFALRKKTARLNSQFATGDAVVLPAHQRVAFRRWLAKE